MKRTLKYALSAVITAAIVAPAMAQGNNFPDTPDNHWAYDALLHMKQEGLLVGYPDGLFRGGRPASRYEMAVAIYATYKHLNDIATGLQNQIDDLKKGAGGNDPNAIKNLQDALTALQNDVNGMKSWGDDIANLKKMADTFQKELASLGVDVEAMKKDMADLADRVGALEKRKLPVDIHGDVNWVGLGGYSKDNTFGIDVQGRPLGYGRGSYANAPVGATRDLTILNEEALELTGTNDTGPKWHGTFVVGNTIGQGGFFNQSRVAPAGFSPLDGAATGEVNNYFESSSQFYVQDFAVTFDTSIAGLGFNAQAGRVGMKISPMMFQRVDNTPYFANERWDNGMWMFDGAILGFHFGGAKVDVFGGRNSSMRSQDGQLIQPMLAGQIGNSFTPGGDRPRGMNSGNLLLIDQSLGIRAGIPLGANGSLDLAYLWLQSNESLDVTGFGGPGGVSPPKLVNGVDVWGGDVKFNLSSIALRAGYAKSDVVYNSRRVIKDDNTAWYANAALNRDRWGINVGYRSVDPQYGAPGDWGRIGIWWNPTDIEGIYGGLHYDLTNNVRLMADGQFYRGRGRAVNAGTGLSRDDKVDDFTVGLGYKMATNYDLTLGYEQAQWRLADNSGTGFTGGKPIERWYNIGFGFNLSDNAKLRFLWQISDYDSKGVAGFDPFVNLGGTKAKGGLISTQLSVKF